MIWASVIFLTCSTKVVNSSNIPWNKRDQLVLDRAKVRCEQIYPDAPCLKYFEKYTVSDYRAICGKKD